MVTTTATTRRRNRVRDRVEISRVLLWAAVIIVTLVALYPFIWALITSFKSQRQALEPTLIPFLQFQPSLENWSAELGLGWAETSKALTNSALIAIGSTAIATVLGALTGYGLARFRYGIGNRNLVSWVLSQRFFAPGGHADSLFPAAAKPEVN